MNKIRETIKKKIDKNIGFFIFIPGLCLLFYIWFTRGDPILELWRQIGLFTTILPFIFSIISWILGIIGNRRKKTEKQIKYMLFSFIYCGIATWIFILDIDLKIRNHDISSLRDLAAYYSCVSLFIWMITIWINVRAYKRIEINDQKEND